VFSNEPGIVHSWDFIIGCDNNGTAMTLRPSSVGIAVTLREHGAMLSKTTRLPRIRKRLSVRFGSNNDLPNVGFTTNVSARGMAISTRVMPKLGTGLHLEISVTPQTTCTAEGHIMWVQRGLQQAGTIGVKLLRADEAYFRLVHDVTPRTHHTASPESVKVVTPHPEGEPISLVPQRVSPSPPISIPPKAAPVAAPTPPQPTGQVLDELPDYLTLLIDDTPAAGARDNKDSYWFTPPWENWENDQADEAGAPPSSPGTSQASRDPRVPARFPMHFGAPGNVNQEGTTINLSASGLALASSGQGEPGETVAFEIHSTRGTSQGTGLIVWVRELEAVPQVKFLGIRLLKSDARYAQFLTPTLGTGR
jgi:hypothetical protein